MALLHTTHLSCTFKDLSLIPNLEKSQKERQGPSIRTGATFKSGTCSVGNGSCLSKLKFGRLRRAAEFSSGLRSLTNGSRKEFRHIIIGGYMLPPGFPSFPGLRLSVGERKSGIGTNIVKALSSSYGTDSLSGDDDGGALREDEERVGSNIATDESPVPSKYKGSLQVVGILAALLGVGTLAALGLTLNSGGPSALLSVVSKSGFPAAFALIFVSEIGDKTFFIAALLAMRHSKWLILLGASGALSIMTVISVIIGKLCQRVPAQLQTTLPVGEYAAVGLLIWFGLRSIKAAWDIPSASAGAHNETEEIGELAEAEKFLKQADDRNVRTSLEVLGEAFTLIFLAEWGDRSMLATIALGAAQSPWGVASGAIAGHVLATLLAVLGGALLARYLSEKLIGYFGGALFITFAAATLAGVF